MKLTYEQEGKEIATKMTIKLKGCWYVNTWCAAKPTENICCTCIELG